MEQRLRLTYRVFDTVPTVPYRYCSAAGEVYVILYGFVYVTDSG